MPHGVGASRCATEPPVQRVGPVGQPEVVVAVLQVGDQAEGHLGVPSQIPFAWARTERRGGAASKYFNRAGQSQPSAP